VTGSLSLVLEPHLPLWTLATLAGLSGALVAWGLVRRAKGALLRLVFAALVIGALANPVLRNELREPLPDIALVVADRSASQRITGRTGEVDAAAATLAERLDALGGVQVREVEVAGDASGTRLVQRIEEAVAEIDRDRLAAVIALTDGQAHDVPADPAAAPPLGAPLHVLLTGRPDETDRRLVIEGAPSFAMVDEPQTVRLKVEDSVTDGAPVRVVVRQDGRVLRELAARPGQSVDIPVTLERAGLTTLEIEAAARPGELTLLNNRAVLSINGVRDRLRVLLVSGQPYPGLRVWRNLLKADPAVDLVHFTILRPPEKQDGTPIRELALIAFPSRELFEVKLKEFDLVIFDRYNRRGLLPLAYLENVARYVEEGGALLEAAGPEFATPTSLYRTPLARVLPGRPSGEVYERPFTPAVSELGRRHPVTTELGTAGDDPAWGQWFRQVDVEAGDGQVLMTGVADRPLLVLQRVGEGRVAQLLSDHAWLWARGYEGGGPQAAMLRRLVHWLMKEPQLEEETLVATAAGEGIAVERRSIEGGAAEVRVTAPDGSERTLPLEPGPDGVARGRVEAAADGLYRITDGTRTAYAQARPIAAIELADVRADAARLTPLVEASDGSIRWLAEEGVPELRRIEPDRRKSGRGWIGLQRNDAFTVTGTTETPLLPAWAALTLLLATAAAAWWREGKA
jgi:hypothetical protein